jgi:hypothetical protein
VNHVTVEMQGVRLQLRSDHQEWLDYVPLHLPDHVVDGGDPHITVDLEWRQGKDAEPLLEFPGQEKLDRIGKRLLAGPNQLVWTNTLRMKNLVLRFELQGEHLHIDAIYHYDPRQKKVDEQPNYRFRKMFSLMSWFVYMPMAWYLEHFRGLYLMHASGLDLNGRGVVIGGVGGVGKTTTGVSLLAQGARLVSENLIFHDDERLYSCYEPIRLDDNSVEILGERRDILTRARIPEGSNHKNLYQVDRGKAVVDRVDATALFLPRFTGEGFVRPLEIEDCMERLIAFNDLTREVNDFYWFAATLNVLWPTPRSLQKRADTLRTLLQNISLWELGIDRSQGVAPVVQAIQERVLAGAGT